MFCFSICLIDFLYSLFICFDVCCFSVFFSFFFMREKKCEVVWVCRCRNWTLVVVSHHWRKKNFLFLTGISCKVGNHTLHFLDTFQIFTGHTYNWCRCVEKSESILMIYPHTEVKVDFTKVKMLHLDLSIYNCILSYIWQYPKINPVLWKLYFSIHRSSDRVHKWLHRVPFSQVVACYTLGFYPSLDLLNYTVFNILDWLLSA